MKVVFLQDDTMAKVAVMQLAALLKQSGHDAIALIDTAERDLVSAALAEAPDLVAFSCTAGSEEFVFATARAVKARSDVPVVLGGPFATFFPDAVRRPEIDFLCRGEGEGALLDLVRALETGTDAAHIPNLWTKLDGEVVENDVRPLVADLDHLASPDWNVYAARYPFLVGYYRGNFPVITSRGCPNRCTYCFNRSYRELYAGKGRYVRRESPEAAVARLVEAKRDHLIRRINFVDDSFADSATWLREFSELYTERIALPFICNVRAGTISAETASLLAESGCYCARMGLETGSERLRREVFDRPVSDEVMRAAVGHLKASRIKVFTFNIFGSPTETLEEALQTYRLNKELDVDFAQCTMLQPYEGTRIREIAVAVGALDEACEQGRSYFVSSPLQLEHKRQITNLQKLTNASIRLRVPEAAVRRLIEVPENALYHAILQAGYAWFRFRLEAREALPFLRFTLHSRLYMRRARSQPLPAEKAS